MSEPTGNLINCPTYKIDDRKAILARTLVALQADEDCRFGFKGEWRKLSTEEQANWDARETVNRLLQEF
jgi:hypothetical protein